MTTTLHTSTHMVFDKCMPTAIAQCDECIEYVLQNSQPCPAMRGTSCLTISYTALRYRVLHQSLNPGHENQPLRAHSLETAWQGLNTRPNQTSVANVRCIQHDKQLL